jgi:hypothetical protein
VCLAQKLARHWKLHHRRGFWRDHPTVSDLARALYNHHITLGSKDARTRALRGTLTKTGPEVREGEEEGFGTAGAGAGGGAGAATPTSIRTGPLFKYMGDKFGTQGDYMDGTLYLSRITQPGQPKGPLAAKAAAAEQAAELAAGACDCVTACMRVRVCVGVECVRVRVCVTV